MNNQNLNLPSNRKFGILFAAIFLVLGVYLSNSSNEYIGYSLITVFFIFILISFTKPDLLLPLNTLWMKFGFFLGRFFNPLIMGVIFFGIFFPVGVIMKIFGRDALKMKIKNSESYWVKKDKFKNNLDFFKNQF